MAVRFLKRLFGPNARAAEPDLTGPLGLAPSDRVEYYQRSFEVTGTVHLAGRDLDRYQYYMKDGQGRPAVLVATRGKELVLSLQEAVPDADSAVLEQSRAVHSGRTFRPARRGQAVAEVCGEVAPAREGQMKFAEYEDAEAIRVLVVEVWGGSRFLLTGDYLHEAEITVHPAGEDGYEVRPPPRLDLRAATEARRAREADEKMRREAEAAARRLAEAAASEAPEEAGRDKTE